MPILLGRGFADHEDSMAHVGMLAIAILYLSQGGFDELAPHCVASGVRLTKESRELLHRHIFDRGVAPRTNVHGPAHDDTAISISPRAFVPPAASGKAATIAAYAS
jgi:hypothetical protein